MVYNYFGQREVLFVDFLVSDYGALGDGKTMNTNTIQASIDECNKHGGGRVVIDDGVFLTGTLILKENVELHITASAVLLGSPNYNDYPEIGNVRHVSTKDLPRYRNACLIFAEECKNISITGMGKIDCNGLNFVKKKKEYNGGWKYERIDAPTPPRVVFFTGCKNVRIEDITMVNQPSGWSYWIHDCDFVDFDRLKILADVEYPNNDGIHINSSRNVTVSNCSIVTGDDCIIVRSNNRSLSKNKICEKVTVTNCNLTSYACGIRIGWLNDGVIKNCTFSNIVMTDTNVGIGIRLPGHAPDEKWADEGREDTLIENLLFDNIIMDEIYGTPIKCSICDSSIVRCDAIQNIRFNNIHAKGLEFPYFSGRKNNKLKNITIGSCSFEKVSDDKLKDYKEHGAFWGRPINNPIFSHITNLTVNNTSFTAE